MKVATILEKMTDTADPVNGAVFEKEVSTSFKSFCAFILSAYKNVTMETQVENGNTLYLFYDGDKATDHIGTYIPFRRVGCFGGSRIGSQNPFLKDYGVELGTSFVKNPFKGVTV